MRKLDGVGDRAGKYLGRFFMDNLPQILSSWNPPSYKRAAVTTSGIPKILSNLTPISTFAPYVAINHPLLTTMPQELCKVTNILAVRAREVGFSNMHRSVRSPQNCRRSQ